MEHTALTLTRPKAAKMLGVSITTMRELIATGEIPHLIVGKGSVRVPVKAIEEYVERASQAR